MTNSKIESAFDRDKKLATHQSPREIIREGKLAKQAKEEAEAKGLELAPFDDDSKKEDTDMQ